MYKPRRSSQHKTKCTFVRRDVWWHTITVSCCVHTKNFTRVSLLARQVIRVILALGGGAYLSGFTPWKQLSSPLIHHEELTTSSALYLLRTSHKRLNIERPRVWVHNINIICIYSYMASPVGSHSSVTFTDYVWITVSSSDARASQRWLAFATGSRTNYSWTLTPTLELTKSSADLITAAKYVVIFSCSQPAAHDQHFCNPWTWTQVLV